MIEAVRGIPHDAKQAAKACLWEFPESDFAAYQAMPDVPRLESYGQYLAVIAAMQADLERQGAHVARVQIPVATMLAELEKHNWPNDTEHRAGVTGELGATL